ncbi:MAG: hypothetical protein Q4Q04_02170 [Methanocorpusculum sp.]|nr:hypothetical protein [Methanocorpusculum sp.]
MDVLYKFTNDESVSTDMFLAFAEFLEGLFGRRVELVSMDYIDPYMKKYVDNDAIFCEDISQRIPNNPGYKKGIL